MSLLSKTCIYAVRASLYVAMRHKDNQYVPIHEIAKDLGLSFHFLTKILQSLSAAQLLRSYRGPNGGVRLARAGKDISLLDVILCMEGEDIFASCILGLKGCGERKPCPLHKEWSRRRKELTSMFDNMSLADAAKQMSRTGVRLTDKNVDSLVFLK